MATRPLKKLDTFEGKVIRLGAIFQIVIHSTFSVVQVDSSGWLPTFVDIKIKVISLYRVTKQLWQNLQLTLMCKLRFSVRTLTQLQINVNRRFCPSCLVTLYRLVKIKQHFLFHFNQKLVIKLMGSLCTLSSGFNIWKEQLYRQAWRGPKS